MIIALDTETQGLNTQKYVIGCLWAERWNKPEFYTQKGRLWNRLVELAQSEAKRGKTLKVYAHNMQYDFYACIPYLDPHLRYTCTHPFIVHYETEEDGTIMEFLDTMELYPFSLKKVGETIGLPKMELPQEFKDGKEITPFEVEMVKPYLARDTEIVLKAIEYLKKKLKEEDVHMKHLITTRQIAINHLLAVTSKLDGLDHFFYNKQQRMLHWPKYQNLIRRCYRGGRCQAFQYGKFTNVQHIDCRSLYPYASMNIPFPDLRTERYVKKPLELYKKERLR